jgi:hypothetical protein
MIGFHEMRQVKIDGVLHNYEVQDWAQYGWPKDPSISYRIFSCPADRKFVRTAQHDFPLAVTKLEGKFRTSGHEYEFV